MLPLAIQLGSIATTAAVSLVVKILSDD